MRQAPIGADAYHPHTLYEGGGEGKKEGKRGKEEGRQGEGKGGRMGRGDP